MNQGEGLTVSHIFGIWETSGSLWGFVTREMSHIGLGKAYVSIPFGFG